MVFSLTGWSPQIQTGFLVSRLTQDTAMYYKSYVYGIITLYDQIFQFVPLQFINQCRGPITPKLPQQLRFGLFPFRSPLLRESIFLSFPVGTKMFQFPTLAHLLRCNRPSVGWVAPFGHLRINSRLQIPADFRSLPRPSSPIEAKASSVCP